MRIHKERQVHRLNYEKMVDSMTSIIEDCESRNYVNRKILEEVREYLASNLLSRPKDYYNYISKQTLRLLEKYPSFDDEKAVVYIKSVLKYNSDITYRTQALTVFTFLESYFNPGKFDDYIVSIKEITSKRS